MLDSNMSATEIGKLVNTHKIKAVEVVKFYEERIEKYNPSFNAFTYTHFDEAFKRAEEIDKMIENMEYVGPFAGVPFALKDFLSSKIGWTNSHGGVKSLITEDKEDSEFCKAMTKLGGIAIGKTNAPSFGFSALTYNKMYGITKNPFDINRNSGGSSGGSASAVGGGLVPIAEGGDGGGSIRIPSSWCNCVGYKPSVGRVPSVCRPDAWTATHPYCFNSGICKTVEDVITLFNEMSKYNPRDPLSVPIDNKGKSDIDTKCIKIGYTMDWNCFKNIENDIVNAFQESICKLKDMGIHLIQVEPKIKTNIKEILDMWYLSISIDTSYDIEELKKHGINLYEREEELPDHFIEWQKRAYSFNIEDYKRFHHIRTELLDVHEDLFEEVDFIVSPVTTILPPYNDEVEKMDKIDFAMTPFQNFTGHPACSLPISKNKNNLPIGLQIVGKKYCDENLLSLMSFIFKNNK